jgi:signal transduction histidine kinase
LIGNAIKFHKQGAKPKIEINAEIIPADKLKFPDQLKTFYKFREWDEDYYWAREKFCRITVRDYGIGFKQEYSDRIFVAFQRLHNQSQYSGTGIGLAICRKIVEYHHGIISATSTSEDTTFTIVVPVSQANFEKREKVNEKPSF